MSNTRSRLSSDAKSDLVFTVPREYAAAIERAVRMKGLTSLTAFGRIVVLEHLRQVGLVDQFFQPIAQEEETDVHDQQAVPV